MTKELLNKEMEDAPVLRLQNWNKDISPGQHRLKYHHVNQACNMAQDRWQWLWNRCPDAWQFVTGVLWRHFPLVCLANAIGKEMPLRTALLSTVIYVPESFPEMIYYFPVAPEKLEGNLHQNSVSTFMSCKTLLNSSFSSTRQRGKAIEGNLR